MSIEYKPRVYQGRMHGFAFDKRRANWWAGPGTGKTSTGLWFFDTLRWFGEARRLLVVSTKRICKTVWGREKDKWDQFKHYSMAVAIGTPDQRLKALALNADITTINYDNLQWLAETVGHDDWPWDTVIADESTKLKSMKISIQHHHKSGKMFLRSGGGSKRAAELAKVSHRKVRNWLNLTGTPTPNGLLDAYGEMWFIDGGARLGRTFTAFKERWFYPERPAGDPFTVNWVPKPHAEAEILGLMNDVTISIDARDYMELPDTVINPVMVPLPEKVRGLYRQMEKEFYIEIEGKDIEAFNSGAKSMKCRQLASGAVYAKPDEIGDAAPWLWVHDEKMDALHDIVDELNGEPILIAYQFRSDLERLMKEFPKGRYFDDSNQTLDDFIAGRIPQLFIHPASGGHGIDGMQAVCNHIAFFSQTFNAEEYLQVIERIGNVRQVSAGYFRNTFVHLLIAENTVDELAAKRIAAKVEAINRRKDSMKKEVVSGFVL
jgi:SNF2 family DNA or RNA helicase